MLILTGIWSKSAVYAKVDIIIILLLKVIMSVSCAIIVAKLAVSRINVLLAIVFT